MSAGGGAPVAGGRGWRGERGSSGAWPAVGGGRAAVAFAVGPVAQDPGYHRFADQRTLFGVARGADVLSNLPLLAAGVAGLLALLGARRERAEPARRGGLSWSLFFLGVALTGIGSAWYHLSPDTSRLFWDRLPMALCFTALLAAVADEGFAPAGEGLAAALLVPPGVASVLWWRWTELRGAGDLRWYVAVKVAPLIVVPVLLVARRRAYAARGLLWAALASYVAAKGAELADAALFRALSGTLSGHTLKHLLVALGAGLLCVRVLRRRAGPLPRVDSSRRRPENPPRDGTSWTSA